MSRSNSQKMKAYSLEKNTMEILLSKGLILCKC